MNTLSSTVSPEPFKDLEYVVTQLTTMTSNGGMYHRSNDFSAFEHVFRSQITFRQP